MPLTALNSGGPNARIAAEADVANSFLESGALNARLAARGDRSSPATPSIRKSRIGSPSMDMLTGEQIAEANLTDWRKLAQGLHARYLVGDFGAGARFVAAVGEAGDAFGHHPRVSIGKGYVDLELVSADAVFRDDEGTEYVIEWVTQQDVDLARRISEIAVDHELTADPGSVSEIELGLDTVRSATIAPVWAALLTGRAESQGLRDSWRRDQGRHGTSTQPVVRGR